MRQVTAKSDKTCKVCRERINAEDDCVQSESRFDCFYHKDCAIERFGSVIIKWKQEAASSYSKKLEGKYGEKD